MLNVFFGQTHFQHTTEVADVMLKMVDRFGTGTKQLIPLGVPLPMNYTFRKRRKLFYERIGEIIDTSPNVTGTLLHTIVEKSENRTIAEGEVANYLGAGAETTADLIAWCFYHVLKDPELHEKLKQEALTVEWPITDHHQFRACPLLHSTINEVLRVLPPLWGTSRKALTDDEVAGYKIPKGSEIIIAPYLLHQLESEYSNAKTLQPDRFVKDPTAVKQSFSFGYGPRTCTGKHLAIAEVAILLIACLRNMDITPHNTLENISWDPGLRPNGDILAHSVKI